jgi:hypothetical protein
MGAVYALLGLVFGVAITEVVRRRKGNASKKPETGRGPRLPRSFAAPQLMRAQQGSRATSLFLAQDYYDR